jgi:hypothetical protein
MGRKWLPYVCFICNSFAFVYFASMDFAPFVLGFFWPSFLVMIHINHIYVISIPPIRHTINYKVWEFI